MAVAAAAWAVDTAEVVAVDTAAVVAVAMVAVAAVDTAAPRPPLARKPTPAPRLAPVAMADTNLDMGKFPFVISIRYLLAPSLRSPISPILNA